MTLTQESLTELALPHRGSVALLSPMAATSKSRCDFALFAAEYMRPVVRGARDVSAVTRK
jgi:hypothetical protein